MRARGKRGVRSWSFYPLLAGASESEEQGLCSNPQKTAIRRPRFFELAEVKLPDIPIKLRKLFAMSPLEVGHRSARALGALWERAQYTAGNKEWSARQTKKRLGAHHPACFQTSTGKGLPLASFDDPKFLLNDEVLSEARMLFGAVFPRRFQQAVEAANAVRHGKFSFLGADLALSYPIAWQTDPLTGKDWSRNFYADVPIPFCDADDSRTAVGDPKIVWELNRHEYLIDCGKAYLLTRDDRYAELVFEIMTSWIADNPYLQGINWAGPLEVAVRSISWIWTLQFCRCWNGFDDELYLKLLKSFYEHGAYLHRHLEVYSSPNNHLVGEALALYFLGSFFPQFDEAPAWRRRGWSILEKEPARQFYSDGGSTEQAAFYHNYCLGFFLLAILLRRKQELPVPESMLQRIERALEFSMWITQPDGLTPRIGDVDDARSIRFENPPLWDFRNLISLGAILFERGDMKAVSGGFSEDALWLMGQAGYDKFLRLRQEAPAKIARLFPDSGYGVFKSGWGKEDHYFCFDCGPIAAGLHSTDIPSSAHGHADMLSFVAAFEGRPLLVDGGFLTYSGDRRWHRYARETAAHNTIRVDGASQAKFNPSNAWSCVAEPEQPNWHSEGRFDYIESAHSGFYGLAGAVRHRRAVVWNRKSYWLVFDRLEGDGWHDVEVFFHLAPGKAVVRANGRSAQVSTAQGLYAQVEAISGADVRAAVDLGGEEPHQGWIATSYGRKVPAPVLTFRGRLQFPVQLCFAIVPTLNCHAETQFQGIELPKSGNPSDMHVSAWEIADAGRTERLGFSWHRHSAQRWRQYGFDAAYCDGRIGLSELKQPSMHPSAEASRQPAGADIGASSDLRFRND